MKNKEILLKNLLLPNVLQVKSFSDAPYWFYQYFVVSAFSSIQPNLHHMSVTWI